MYGAQSGLTALTAAVLGGIGRPRGAFVAGLLLGVVAAFSDYFLAAAWTPILLLALLIVLLVMRPTGLGSEDSDVVASPMEVIAGRDQNASRPNRVLLGVLLVLGVLYPILDSLVGGRTQVVALGVLVFVLLALGLNVVLGFAGLLDLGFAAYFGIGAYTAGVLTTTGGPLAWLGVANNVVVLFAISAGAAALFGLVNGLLTLRLRGEYLAIVTLTIGQLTPLLLLNLDRWTGGARGMSALPPPRLYALQFATPTARYYLAFALVALVAFASLRLRRSRLGRAWAALSVDESAAVSCGIPPARLRCLAFVVGAAVAGLAGAVFASGFSYVDPTQAEFRLSAMVLAMVVVGGTGSVPGAIIGAFLIAGIDQFAIPVLGGWAANLADQGVWFMGMFDVRTLNYLAFGVALYLTTLLRVRRSRPGRE